MGSKAKARLLGRAFAISSAGGENRTPNSTLEESCFTTKLRPLRLRGYHTPLLAAYLGFLSGRRDSNSS